jgi:CRISPR/Cas system CSM-associated protein Csm2 small subunit
MTLLTGIILTNLVISLFLAYKCGKQQVEIATLYEGLAMTMEKLSMTATDDD